MRSPSLIAAVIKYRASPSICMLYRLAKDYPEHHDYLVETVARKMFATSPSASLLYDFTIVFPKYFAYLVTNFSQVVLATDRHGSAYAFMILAFSFPKCHEYLVLRFAQAILSTAPCKGTLFLLIHAAPKYDYLFKDIDPCEPNAINKRIVHELNKARVPMVRSMMNIGIGQGRASCSLFGVPARVVQHITRYVGLPKHVSCMRSR